MNLSTTDTKEKVPSPEQIIKAVCIACNVKLEQLQNIKKTRDVAEARSICAGLIFQYHPKFTLQNVGDIFNRKHSAVINSRRLFSDLMDTDKNFQKKVTTVKDFLFTNMFHFGLSGTFLINYISGSGW